MSKLLIGIFFIWGAVIIISSTSCGRADGMVSGQIIPSPAGYTCFAIMKEGDLYGGNCIKTN